MNHLSDDIGWRVVADCGVEEGHAVEFGACRYGTADVSKECWVG